MTNTCRLSNNTKEYIEVFQGILLTMAEKMKSARQSDSISGSFIAQMIPHHSGAIEMSKNLLRYTTNIPLQDIALNIISSQEESIKNMTAVYPGCKCYTDTIPELSCYRAENERIIRNMLREMKAACTDNSIDANFIREMIPHHRGAVLMSQNALRFFICPELKPLLQSIIVSQEKGIRQMEQLLAAICR